MSYVHVHRGSFSAGPMRVLPQGPAGVAKLQPFSRQSSAPYSFGSERERSPRAVPRLSVASVYVQPPHAERTRRYSEVAYEWTPPATPMTQASAAQFFDTLQDELDCAPLPVQVAGQEGPGPVKASLLHELEAMQDAIDSLACSAPQQHARSLPVSPVTKRVGGATPIENTQSATEDKLWRPW
eukprot:comp22885_c0_seq1/m.36164 comp22885_c0_seq1/g.36164  ORF comp22885_c0_seq1/g.36164 comp22885_c0_seq1/m.36164 type:complete len:183 (-) comp22885_c0_seq1:674-1222(-)